MAPLALNTLRRLRAKRAWSLRLRKRELKSRLNTMSTGKAQVRSLKLDGGSPTCSQSSRQTVKSWQRRSLFLSPWNTTNCPEEQRVFALQERSVNSVAGTSIKTSLPEQVVTGWQPISAVFVPGKTWNVRPTSHRVHGLQVFEPCVENSPSGHGSHWRSETRVGRSISFSPALHSVTGKHSDLPASL